MKQDMDLFMRGLVEVASGFLWLAIVGLMIYLFVLWFGMFNQIDRTKGGIGAKLFPVYLFYPSCLTEKGQLIRRRFFRILLIVVVLIGILSGIIVSGAEGLDQSMFE
ncbi:hypothetical protein OQJ62_16350 [Microbulbifer thermotolerans]|uniref:hypothetical protein n=1 Tax=Microbulbifer thermotolerans TaxID=252514 RepID=UPI0022496727|nr:hypothetical protein [Microbulbifer thermotolerans]MCX2796484.1 hypothetical protein [Microbulbifer thermotolerans]